MEIIVSLQGIGEEEQCSTLSPFPDDWCLFTIQNLLKKKYILDHLDGNHGGQYPRSDEFKEYGIPYISANDFLNGFVDFTRCKFLSETKAKLFKKGVARDDDVLFAHNATVGPVALLKTSLDFVILSTTATYFRCNEAYLCNIFLKYALQASFFVKQYQAVMAQSTRFQVPITAQRKLSLILPPLPEQQAIATALSDIDALITSLDKLIAKKHDIKQATMQQLLTGKTRLPGFSKELKPAYKQTEVGMIPKDWGMYSLGDIVAKVGSGITPRGGEKVYKKSGRPFLRSQNVGWGHLLLDDIVFIDEETHNSFLSTELKQNDVLLNITGASIGRSAVADNRLLGGNVNQHVSIIRVDASKLSPYYLNLFLLSKIGQKQIESFQAGGNRQGLNFGQIKSFQIPLPEQEAIPSLPEQQAIATVLSDMDAEIAALEHKREKTHMLKQGMMQELLTGKTRLI